MDLLSGFANDHLFNIVVILALVFLVRRFADVIIKKLVRRAIKPDRFRSESDEKQREDTLISTISAGVRVVIWILTGLLVLSEIGIDIAPLLAGAGIAGVALGFGAQSMVKDFLSGLFILIENQYRVGDVIKINRDVPGRVERITLRSTVLRDLDGMVHHIPNGVIEIATNMTMEYANVNLDIGVGYDSDLDKVEEVVNKVCMELAEDKDWAPLIKEPAKFFRVDEFGDSAIIIKIIGKTQPMKQWQVTGELRKRLKKAFDKAGIEIPFPQRVIHQAKPAKAKKK